MEEGTKKTLLYGGGAIASIIAVVYLFKRSSSPGTPVTTRTGAGAGGVSSNPLAAAQLNAATALAIEQGRENLAQKQIDASLQIEAIRANKDITTAGIVHSAKTAQAGIGAAAGPAGVAATKGVFDIIKDLINKAFGGTGLPSNYATLGGVPPDADLSALPPGYALLGGVPGAEPPADAALYNADGSLSDAATLLGGTPPDYYLGDAGSGGNSWFGTSPGEESAGYGNGSGYLDESLQEATSGA